MRLIVTAIDLAGGHRVLAAMRGQGLPAVMIFSEGGALGDGHATLLIGVHDADVGSICATVASLVGGTERPTQALLPLSDPTDLHVGRMVNPGDGNLGMFMLRVSRFEQIW